MNLLKQKVEMYVVMHTGLLYFEKKKKKCIRYQIHRDRILYKKKDKEEIVKTTVFAKPLQRNQII